MKQCALILLVVGLVAAPFVEAAAAENKTATKNDPIAGGLEAKKAGDVVTLGGHKVTVREIKITPVVRNTYSQRFLFDSYDNPKLRKLRQQEKLEEVVAEGKDEFDRQVILLDWVYKRIRKFGAPTKWPQGALDIFQAVDQGHTFYCAHFATSLVSCAASLGWINRSIALHVSNNPPGGGATEHSTTEIWSNQYAKWVLFDPTYAMYIERDGVPLSGWEVRQEWFYGDRGKLDFVIGRQRRKHKAKDMPIFRASHAGFGDLSLAPRSIDKLAFMGIISNTNLMDAGPDYAKMFILKDDKVCQGVNWHRRDNPADPTTEPYFPLNQADLKLTPVEGKTALGIEVDSMTPNLADYRFRLDGKTWKTGKPREWSLHKGTNTLEVVTVNKFGVEGVPSKVVLEVN